MLKLSPRVGAAICGLTIIVISLITEQSFAQDIRLLKTIPQLCNINMYYAKVNFRGEIATKDLGKCLGGLISIPEDIKADKSNAVITAGHCDPREAMKSLSDPKFSKSQYLDYWTKEFDGATFSAVVECFIEGRRQASPVDPLNIRFPNSHYDIRSWVIDQLVEKKTVPDFDDIAVFRFKTGSEMWIPPLAIFQQGIAGIVSHPENCFLPRINQETKQVYLTPLDKLALVTADSIMSVGLTANPGDSGGPLLCKNGESLEIAGVISAGIAVWGNSAIIQTLSASTRKNISELSKPGQ